MKRVLTVLVLLSGACVLHAEEMKFVTTLSSPLGTFAQLETADYSATTSVPLLNFCNTRASVGTVTLKGANSYLQTVYLKNGTTLGGNTPEYRISGTLAVNAGGEVEGGRLLANAATVSGASSAKSKVEDTLYAASLKVKGAKAASLTIPGQVQTVGTGSGLTMYWSNSECSSSSAGNGGVEFVSMGEGLGYESKDYVDVKDYIYPRNTAYTDGKPLWYLYDGDNDQREFDLNCECVVCFDEGAVDPKTKSFFKTYFQSPTLCKDSNWPTPSLPTNTSSAQGLAEYVQARPDPSYYEQDGFWMTDVFYSHENDYMFGGHYGSNGGSKVEWNASCDGTTHDLGPSPFETRKKSFAMGCLYPTKKGYVHHYCAFWNCKIWKKENDSCDEETDGGSSYLLKSR
ncbi:hypothetical protein [Candidatus Avelusimicrobium alvi]|uniref:hypothetical protein n=1 Tax=Candidatus Avelusimicrobium alvi TaxID=3416221 RepID=UPI003D0D4471